MTPTDHPLTDAAPPPMTTPMTILRALAVTLLILTAASCQSTSVRTFATPGAATAAMIEAIDAGDVREADEIFDGFARASVQRDRVYAELYGTAEARFESGDATGAAEILEFLCAKYPAAVNAREALLYARFLGRAETGVQNADDLRRAIAGYRNAAQAPSAWADLAETWVAIDTGDMDLARSRFQAFLTIWDGTDAQIMPHVEDISRYLETH